MVMGHQDVIPHPVTANLKAVCWGLGLIWDEAMGRSEV